MGKYALEVRTVHRPPTEDTGENDPGLLGNLRRRRRCNNDSGFVRTRRNYCNRRCSTVLWRDELTRTIRFRPLSLSINRPAK